MDTRRATESFKSMRGYASRVAVIVIVAATTSASMAQENRVSLTNWDYTRARKTVGASNKVTAGITLANVSDAVLEDVKVAISLHSGLGKQVAGPFRRNLGRVKPGESKPIRVTALFIAAFGSYRILVTYKGGEEKWISSTAEDDPQPLSDKLIPNISRVILLGQELTLDPSKRLSGKVKVKNIGELQATDVTVTVTFHAPPPKPRKPTKKKPKVGEKKAPVRGKKLGEWKGKLGNGKLGSGKEEVFSVKVTKPYPRGCHSHLVSVTCKETPLEQQIGGNEFENAKDVQAAQWNFKRTGKLKDTLLVSCKVRNGLEQTVEKVRFVLSFFVQKMTKNIVVKKVEYVVPGTIKAGEVKDVTFQILKMPKFDGYQQELAYGEAGGGPDGKGGTAPPAGQKKFPGKDNVEVIFKDFASKDDGTVMIVCAARNGRPLVAKNVVVTVRFIDGKGKEITSIEKELPEPMIPGEIRNFVVSAPKAAGYAKVTHEVSFIETRVTKKKPKKPGEVETEPETVPAVELPPLEEDPGEDAKEKKDE